MWARLRSFLGTLLRRRRFEDDVTEELRFHLESYAADLERTGLSSDGARRRARAEFGLIDDVREAARSARGQRPFDALRDIADDARYATRALTRNRRFAVACVMYLGVAIGMNTTVFSIVDALLLQPLPLAAPEELVRFYQIRDDDPAVSRAISFSDFQTLQAASADSFTLGAMETSRVTVSHGTDVFRPTAGFVSWSLFPLFGLQPIHGRGFSQDDDRAGGPAVVLLGHSLWRERYGEDLEILGRSISIGGVSHTVIGVMPEGLAHPRLRRLVGGSSLWLPISSRPVAVGEQQRRGTTVYARPGPVASTAAGAEGQAAIAASFDALMSRDTEGWKVAAEPLRLGFSGLTLTQLRIATGAVGFVLLLACANVATLTLARTSGRRREIGTRLALGAPRVRVVRQLSLESIVIALVSVPIGVLMAYVGGHTLGLEHYASSGPINPRVLAFAVGLSTLVGVLTGLIPAVITVRGTRTTDLRGGVRSDATSRPRHARTTSTLVVVQVALSLVLLVGASLFERSFRNLLDAEGGFDTSRLLLMTLAVPPASGSPDTEPAGVARLIDSLAVLPDVSGVAATTSIPLSGAGIRMRMSGDGLPVGVGAEPTLAYVSGVSAAFFDVLRVPIARGRMFSDVEERQEAAVAVVNEALAARLWPGEDPLGRTIRFDGRESESFAVIGVSKGILAWTLSNRPVPTAYLPYARAASGEPRLLLKATGEEPGRLAGPARAAVRAIVPQWSVSGVATMTDVHYEVLSRNRTLAWLFAVLGVVALLLAASGIYALMSYLVTQRTREIGVRTALGAGPWRLAGGFLREGVTVVALGAAVGTAGSWALARVVLAGLYGLSTADPISILGASGIMVVVGVLATFLPARRAASVDPVVAMRD